MPLLTTEDPFAANTATVTANAFEWVGHDNPQKLPLPVGDLNPI